MNMKNIFYCLLPGLLFGACSNKVYEETGANGQLGNEMRIEIGRAHV